MNNNINKRTINILIVSFAFLGVLCILSGLIMPSFALPKENVINFSINQERIEPEVDSFVIRPRNLTKEIHQPMSENILDYLYDIHTLDENIIKELVLDISSVNIYEPGVYTYFIFHNDNKYTGSITVRERDLPRLDLTLRSLSFERGSVIPTDINMFIEEVIPVELLSLMTIDLSNVDTNVVATHQYTITFNGRLFTGTISIFEPQPRAFISFADDEDE